MVAAAKTRAAITMAIKAKAKASLKVIATSVGRQVTWLAIAGQIQSPKITRVIRTRRLPRAMWKC